MATYKLLVELPISLVQEPPATQGNQPSIASTGTTPVNAFDEIFLRNPKTGNYIRVFADPADIDADSRILSQPCQLPVP